MYCSHIVYYKKIKMEFNQYLFIFVFMFQLQPNSAAGSGALEHNPCCLYRPVPQVNTLYFLLRIYNKNKFCKLFLSF